MANRVTEAELRAYLGLAPTVTVLPYLDDAHVLVDTFMGVTPTVGEAVATLVEKNLAAHLYTIAYVGGELSQKKVGESSETYANGKNLGGIGSTRFGRLALAFDTSNSFAGMTNVEVKKAQFRVA